MRRIALWLTVIALGLLTGAQARAATLERIGSFVDPTFVISEPNDPDRLLVVEQAGRIELFDDGVVTPYLDLTDLVSTGGEQGLLSVAPAPDYASSGLLYVYYTDNAGNLQIDEFRASTGSASLASRRPVMTIPHPTYRNHNGGQLQFGPDGYLYVGTGDGGGGGDPDGNAQDLNTRLGKLLRIDPRAAGTAPYSIPPGNPYAGSTAGLDEIWSSGLRNPWRFSFDRLTGDLVIGDVGQSTWEEVDYARAPAAGRGANFGWDRCEGLIVFPVTTPPSPCPAGGLTAPVLQYGRGGGACAITGGYVVRDPSVADLYGRYLFADVCNARVSSVRLGIPGGDGSALRVDHGPRARLVRRGRLRARLSGLAGGRRGLPGGRRPAGRLPARDPGAGRGPAPDPRPLRGRGRDPGEPERRAIRRQPRRRRDHRQRQARPDRRPRWRRRDLRPRGQRRPSWRQRQGRAARRARRRPLRRDRQGPHQVLLSLGAAPGPSPCAERRVEHP